MHVSTNMIKQQFVLEITWVLFRTTYSATSFVKKAAKQLYFNFWTYRLLLKQCGSQFILCKAQEYDRRSILSKVVKKLPSILVFDRSVLNNALHCENVKYIHTMQSITFFKRKTSQQVRCQWKKRDPDAIRCLQLSWLAFPV